MTLTQRAILAVSLIVASAIYIVPWDKMGIDIPALSKPYTLGLDLQGGIELDYKIDFDSVVTASGAKMDKNGIIEGIKTIIDKRVGSLGLSEPNIQTANYGDETHVIVQIPTQDYGDIGEEEKEQKSRENIAKAKETIGKVVKLEFKEEKKSINEEDKLARRVLAESAAKELQTSPMTTVGAKYRDQYEMVAYYSASGSVPAQFAFTGMDSVTLPHTTGVRYIPGAETIGLSGSTRDPGEYAIMQVTARRDITAGSASGSTGATVVQKEYDYALIRIAEQPSMWTVAKTTDGRILNDAYLVSAASTFNQSGQPQIELLFNDEGKSIFADITKRLLGKQLAIYVGGQALTAPTIQSVIPDGRAVITGEYTIASAKELANNINTGIVPAPIYLTSERTIDAKIGSHALREILIAGLIGLATIFVFLTFYYRVSGLLAGVALIAYTTLLIALVKLSGPVLTLASIAGVILSIGLAIDANILIFERMREAIRDGHPLQKAVHIGFDKSWTAIWDSHITSLTSAVILFVMGVSMIKWFGLMLGLGIVLSLFTSMWISRVLIEVVAKKMGQNTELFVGEKR
jgi:protein-export membrane protein SecD